MLKGKILAGILAGALLIVATGCTVENPPADPGTNTVVHDNTTTAVPVPVPGPATHTQTNTTTTVPDTAGGGGSSTTTTTGG
jgi:hypothetical protein